MRRPTRPRLIALDLDGTLLDPACVLPPAHAETVRRLTGSGIRVCLATGRPLLTVRGLHRRLDLDGPLVCFNGAWVGLPDGPTIDERALDRDEIGECATLLAAYPGSISVYPAPDRWTVHRFTDRTRGWPDLYAVEIAEEPGVVTDPPPRSCKVMFVCEPELTPTVLAALHERFDGRLHVTASQADRIEITRRAVNKGTGFRTLLAHLGVPAEAAWAVGDGENDLEMLAAAGRGLAMGHAPERVRAAADGVLPPIAEHGLSALRGLIEGGGG